MNSKVYFFIFLQFFIIIAKAQLNANQIYKISSDYIVSIVIEHNDKSKSTGSGFYLEEINAIGTNYHVIKDYDKLN